MVTLQDFALMNYAGRMSYLSNLKPSAKAVFKSIGISSESVMKAKFLTTRYGKKFLCSAFMTFVSISYGLLIKSAFPPPAFAHYLINSELTPFPIPKV
jgi:hypothetical protein